MAATMLCGVYLDHLDATGQGGGLDGSELIVTWFQYPRDTDGRIDVPHFAVEAIDWRAHARIFDI